MGSESLKTLGQIACEAFDLALYHGDGHDPDIWQSRDSRERAAWEAAVQAAIAAVVDPPLEIVTAGADHLALQLLDERDPRGPRWQAV